MIRRAEAWPLTAALALTLGPFACATSSGARFQGTRSPRTVDTEDLRQHTYVPHDHVAVGTVTATCQRDESELGDDACSELELMRRMREAAADAGGTAFVAPSCRDEVSSSQRRWIHCQATVARERASTAADAPSAEVPAPQQRRWPVVIDGATVQVTALPRAGVEPAPRPVDQVRRTWNAAPESERLGIVETRCEQPCQRGQATRALLQGAAWLGAAQVSEVRCVERTAGRWGCRGEAIGP